MSERNSRVPSKISVEDLLRLKRRELPKPEFWTEFERNLRQKQLAALVEKRSWWHNLVAVYGRFGRLGLPLGAAAILAVTFVALRNHSWMQGGAGPFAGENSPREKLRSLPVSVAETGAHEDRPAMVAAVHPPPAEAPASTSVDKGSALAAVNAAGAMRPAVTPVSWLDDVLDDHGGRTETVPPARSIAVNLAAVAPIEPDLVDSVARPLGFEERAMPMARFQHSAEMLPTAAAVTEPRRTRLLASLGSAEAYAPEPSAPEHARRSVLRYLAEDGWDRSMSRLEAEGDKLSIKF